MLNRARDVFLQMHEVCAVLKSNLSFSSSSSSSSSKIVENCVRCYSTGYVPDDEQESGQMLHRDDVSIRRP